MADNMGYENMKCEELYTSLIPPECKGMNLPFTNKGDVYFYGWVLVELALGRKPETGYQLDETLALLDKEVHVGSLKELISRCLKEVSTFFFILIFESLFSQFSFNQISFLRIGLLFRIFVIY